MLVLVPERLISFSTRGDGVAPHFLGDHDRPWLRVLLEEAHRFVGRRRSDLEEHLAGELPCASPAAKRRIAAFVLRRLWGDRRGGGVAPRRVREAVFGEAARAPGARDEILLRVASSLGFSVTEIEESLFADLPAERLVQPRRELSPQDLALATNQAIAQSLLSRSTAVRIRMEGGSRAVVRLAKLRGLICSVGSRNDGSRGTASGGDCRTLEISGPFSLFRHTLVYGRALAALLPVLAWCHRFELHADCVLRSGRFTVRLASGDPILPGREPRVYDSRLEERFARDFRRAAIGWDVIREPEPIAIGSKGALLFPDFALVNRSLGRRWLLEIVGFWTPEYVARKLEAYRAARLSNLVLCIDEARRCAAQGALPTEHERVLFFRRRIDPRAVLELLA